MAFKLSGVVPWGRNLREYRDMFRLTEDDLQKRIAGFGDGPASFNRELTEHGGSVISFDPIYQFTKEDIEKRIGEVRVEVMEQMWQNKDNYVWTRIKSLDELENLRMSAMNRFLEDYGKGRAEGRYVYHELPDKLPFEDDHFDIGLSSHFLLMYTALGYDFHIKAMAEMLRVCKQIRIFPIVDLDANKTELVDSVIGHFRENYRVDIVDTDYEFQKGDNKMLMVGKGR
ncbi:MAG: class I SAM-dependent methyltransferase [Oscillospiraceae bacterium]|nr:class I SAM-dependent methyltransferase [Oscillospiraceae bacterium]